MRFSALTRRLGRLGELRSGGWSSKGTTWLKGYTTCAY
jgi:hypothetical protein